jgi:hypothetical protein
LAWAFDITPEGIRRAEPVELALSLPGMRHVRLGREVGALLLISVVLVIAALVTWRLLLRPSETLDRARVVVYPLDVPSSEHGGLGEDLATWVGWALESTGRLTWIDGWWDIQRAGLGAVSGRRATQVESNLTRDEGAAFFVRGRVWLQPDSVVAHIELHDVENDAVAAWGQTAVPQDPGWIQRAGEDLARQLLAVLLPGEEGALGPASSQDTTPAAAEFLSGERAYRRARFGEALEHYKRALELDSLLAPAAHKGALAACWHLHCEGAEEFVEVTLRRPGFLAPRRLHFAYGIKYYLDGQADSAVSRFRQAIAIDSTFWDAWARLAETYTHLLPSESPLDSLAEATFQLVRVRSPEFYPVLFHLSMIAVRKGEIARAGTLLSEFREVEPDSSRVAVVELMLDCVANSPEMVDWRGAMRRDPNIVYEAVQSLAVAGSQTECARSGWTAILAHDTATAGWGPGRRFGSLFGLQSLLVAEGRYDDLVQLLDAQIEFGPYAGDLFLLDANAGAASEDRARVRADELRAAFAARSISAGSSWMLGVWEANHGRVSAVHALADSLTARAAGQGDRLAGMLGNALEARALLAAGDSSRAIEGLQALAPTKKDPWYPWETLAAEQLLLAQLLYARGDYTAAARVAANFDAPARPLPDLIYLAQSLALRLQAAHALGDDALAQQYRRRLAALGRDDLLRHPGQD